MFNIESGLSNRHPTLYIKIATQFKQQLVTVIYVKASVAYAMNFLVEIVHRQYLHFVSVLHRLHGYISIKMTYVKHQLTMEKCMQLHILVSLGVRVNYLISYI